MARLIDTHIHVWDLKRAAYDWLQHDQSILNQTWNITQLEEERKKTNVVEGVLVQAAGNLEDTALMFESAASTSWITGVVAWLPLTDPDLANKILEEQFLGQKYFKGVRHQVHDEANVKWLLQPTVLESLSILAKHDIPYDIVGTKTAHLETALEVAEQVPQLRMVLDHLNWPPIPSKEKFGHWGALMKEAALHRNFYAKISGLGTAAGDFLNRTTEDIIPYVEFAIQHFGTGRCFCGSDWPVSLLVKSYSHTWQQYEEIMHSLLSDEEADKVFYTNAKSFYDL